MATLTYDSSEAKEEEFTEQEQENIKVGEALEEQQNQLLAGKFKDAEDLESAYIELQKKLGEPKGEVEEKEEPTQELEIEKEEEKTEETDVSFLDRLWDESQNEFTNETIQELEKMDPKDLAKMHLDYRNKNQQPQITDSQVKQLKDVVGGESEYQNMMSWAQKNLQKNEVDMYDRVMENGDPTACYFAIQALKYRFDDSSGIEGEMLTGKAPTNTGDVYRSQAEVVRAMSDPKYENDPAYRQDVYNKLERSNLEF